MRNLKKILALVLALIMSLSLMATAGAKDFPDSDGITNDAYALAVDILSDLDVFNGDQNGNFNPTADITRAEVAAIIYRIATGDVGVDGYKTYAPYNQFKDINVEDWYAGYVTYCANAGYIKGRNTGNFDAKDPVTGYEVLAMILRAVGYDKNNEFVGSNWQLNTASIATEKGVLANVLKDGTVRLSEPATRQVVAEMLFRAIFIDMVDWNAATLSYVPNGKTLAKENLGTESVTGVIMANEWANINEGGEVVLAEGKTELKPVDEKALTLDTSTDLDAVGLTYNAYIQNGTRVLGELEYNEDMNSVAFNEGAAYDVGDLAYDGSLRLNADTAYFLNYNEAWEDWSESDYRVSYAIAQSSCTPAWANYITGLAKINADGTITPATDGREGHTYRERNVEINGVSTACYVVAIEPDCEINQTDLTIMQRIFYTADRVGNNTDDDGVREYVMGEVYIGTTSMEDVSDTLSWKEFTAKYFQPVGEYKYEDCENGESLRIISNDGDNVADYIFKVEYWQDKAIDTYKDALEFYVLDLSDYYYQTFVDEIAVGDVVNYTDIDGRVTVYKANMITGKVTEKNFKDTTILTTADDTVYGQSEIYNNTYMDERIMQTEDETEYNFYLDEFGYIRTYELAQGSQYALLTEIYSTTNQAYNYVNTGRWTVEMKIGDADLDEYNIANVTGNPFISTYAWTSRVTRYNNGTDLNMLQPAIAHLGIANALSYVGATVGTVPGYVLSGTNAWNRGVFEMIPAPATTNYGVFDYGPVDAVYNGDSASKAGTAVEHSFSFTNVAAYTMDDDGNVTLRTASKLKTDRNNNQLYYWKTNASYAWTPPSNFILGIGGDHLTAATWRAAYVKATGLTDTAGADQTAINAAMAACLVPVYDVDYVQLQKEGIKSGMRHFYVDSTYEANYNGLSNGYVNATVETEFYIAMPNGVLHFVGYDNLPTIAAKDIRAAYAVATNSSDIWDAEGYDYWIANVIVIETEQLDNAYESISLMYYNPNEVSGSTRYVDSLNNQWRSYQPDSDDEAKITVVPKASNAGSPYWGNASWSGNNYGFYCVYDSDYADGILTAGDVKQLSTALGATDWAAHKIYAGTVQRVWGLNTSEYIDVDYQGRFSPGTPINDTDVKSVTVTTASNAVPIYRVDKKSATDLRLGERVAKSDVQPGDELILVYNNANALAYIVDLASRTKAYDGFDYTADKWLWDNYDAIIYGQKDHSTPGDDTPKTVTFEAVLTGFEQLEIYNADGSEKLGTLNGTYPTVTIDVAAGTAIVTYQIKALGGAEVAAVVPAAGSDWLRTNLSPVAGTSDTWTVTLVDTTVKERAARADSNDFEGKIYTKTGVTALLTEIQTLTTAGINSQADLDQALAYKEELAAIKANAASDYATTAITEKEGAIDTAISTATTVTVVAGGTTSAIILPEVTTLIPDNGDVSFEVQVKAGYTLTDDQTSTITKKDSQTGATEGYVIYTVSKTSIASDITITVTATAKAATVTLATTDANVTATGTISCSAGVNTAAKTIEVTTGYTPYITVSTAGVVVTATKAADQEGATAGKTIWNLSVTGADENCTATITARPDGVALTLAVNSTDANVTSANQVITLAANGTGSVTVTVKNGYKPSAANIAFTKGTVGTETTTWTGAISGVTAPSQTTVTTVAEYVTLAVSGAHITLDSAKTQIALTSGAGSAAAAITLDEGYAPKTDATGVTFVEGTPAEGKVPYTVNVTGQTVSKTITITAEEIKTADVTFTANANATVKLDGESEAVDSPLEDQVVGSTVSFTVTPKTNYAVVAVKDGGTTLEADDGVYTITVAEGGNTITVETAAVVEVSFPSSSTGYTVSGISLSAGDDGKYTTTVGTTVSLTVTPDAGYTVVVKAGSDTITVNATTPNLYEYEIPSTATAGDTITITVTATQG